MDKALSDEEYLALVICDDELLFTNTLDFCITEQQFVVCLRILMTSDWVLFRYIGEDNGKDRTVAYTTVNWKHVAQLVIKKRKITLPNTVPVYCQYIENYQGVFVVSTDKEFFHRTLIHQGVFNNFLKKDKRHVFTANVGDVLEYTSFLTELSKQVMVIAKLGVLKIDSLHTRPYYPNERSCSIR